MKKSFIYPIIFMSIITAFFVFILASMNYSTAEKVEFLQETELMEKILYVFDIDLPSDDPEEINTIFKENIEEEEIDGEKLFYLMEDGEVKAIAFPSGGSGLWGTIEAYVGVRSDYSEIVGVDFIEHSETPGLGGRIDEKEFKEQFRGLDLEDVEGSNYIIYKPASGGNVDAIAGATLTSKSVSNFLNKDIDEFTKEREGD